MPSLCSEFTEPSYADPALSVVLTGRLQQRLRASQQDEFEEREFLNDLMSTEVVADRKTVWMMAYISRCWDNHWALLKQLLNAGEFDIVLSPMALSRLCEIKYLRLEALVGRKSGLPHGMIGRRLCPNYCVTLTHFSHSWMRRLAVL